jgi:cytidylate kinase
MKRDTSLSTLLASIRGSIYLQQQQACKCHAGCSCAPAPPFVTVSRQAGAGGRALARGLAERLNEREPAADRPWTVWDRELVERVAAEHHIPESAVESLEGGGPRRTWLDELALAISPTDTSRQLDEFQVYRRVAQTVRTLARAGRVVLVGRGGVYATRDLAGGVHVRLVAPFEHRVAHTARQANVPEREAADEVRRTDREREALHRRYWPGRALLPEVFTITLNTADVEDEDLRVDCILPLISAAAQPDARRRNGAEVPVATRR